MISARDLLAQCCGVIVNGCNHPNTQMTVQRLELNLRSRHGGKDVRSGKSSTPAPRSSPPLTRLLTAILTHVTGLTWDLHAAWSASSGDCLNNVEAITQQQYDMAELYGIIPVMVAALTELDEECKLAIATAASATGLFEAIAALCDKLDEEFFSVAPHVDEKTITMNVHLASSIVELWESLVAHWPPSARLLVGKHLALLAQPVTNMLHLLWQFINVSLQCGLVMPSKGGIMEVFQTCKTGTLTLTRCISREAAAVAVAPQGDDLQQSRAGVTLQSILASDKVQMLFSLGAAIFILDTQKYHAAKQQAMATDRTTSEAEVQEPPAECLRLFRSLLRPMQLSNIHPGLFNMKSESKPWKGNQQLADLPSAQSEICRVLQGVVRVFGLLSQPAMMELQNKSDVMWVAVATPLLDMVKRLVLGIIDASSDSEDPGTTGRAERTAMLAIDAMIAIWEAHLLALEAMPSCSSYQHIISSMAAIEQCIRSAGATSMGQRFTLQQASSVVSIIAANRHQLLLIDLSTSDKNISSLLITCLKLAQAYSMSQPAAAAALAQHVLTSSLELSALPSKTDVAAAVPDDQNPPRGAVSGDMVPSGQLEMVSMLAGRSFFIMGDILQRASGCDTAEDQQEAQPECESYPWLPATISFVEAFLAAGEGDVYHAAAAALQASLKALHKQQDEATSTATLKRYPSSSKPEGTPSTGLWYSAVRAVADCGTALSTEFPVPYCCNNPSCVNMSRESELLLVSGKGSVCSGCHIARYCSKECQKRHWKKHKLVCKVPRSATTVTPSNPVACDIAATTGFRDTLARAYTRICDFVGNTYYGRVHYSSS